LHVRLELLNTQDENQVFASFIDKINCRHPLSLDPHPRLLVLELATRT